MRNRTTRIPPSPETTCTASFGYPLRDHERIGSAFVSSGVVTFVRAVGGRVLRLCSERGWMVPEIENSGLYEGFDDLGFDTTDKGQDALVCALIAQAGAAAGGWAAAELADPVSTSGFIGTVAARDCWWRRERLFRKFLPVFNKLGANERVAVRGEILDYAREVIGENWQAVSGTAVQICNLGTRGDGDPFRLPALSHPRPATPYAADSLIERSLERAREQAGDMDLWGGYDIPPLPAAPPQLAGWGLPKCREEADLEAVERELATP